MQLSIAFLVLLAAFACGARELRPRVPSRVAVTSNVFNLRTSAIDAKSLPPSSKFLAKARRIRPPRPQSNKRQDTPPIASVQEDLLTMGGRVYMTDVTLAGNAFTLVIDTGSSDTWVAAANFKCIDPGTMFAVATSYCNFGNLYDLVDSPTWHSIPGQEFGVNYTGGEFLSGELGTELLGIGGVYDGGKPKLVVNQTIGVVEEGFWLGDGVSSGLMGLAYPALVSGANNLAYRSVIFTLLQDHNIPPIFSLALSRPSADDIERGGMIAIGGIPNVPYEGDFVTVPIQPVYKDIFAYYSIIIDGFDIRPPSSPSSTLRPKASALARNRKPRTSKALAPRPTNNTRIITQTRTRTLTRTVKPSPTPGPRLRAPRIDASQYKAEIILDSGSTLMYLPVDVSNYIAALFSPPAIYDPSTELYVVDCDAKAPRVGIIIGGKSFFIHEEDLMNKSPGAVGGAGVGLGQGECALGFQPASLGNLVLGDAWLKNVLAVFDLGENVIRIAAREVY